MVIKTSQETTIIDTVAEVLGVSQFDADKDLYKDYGFDSLDMAELIYTIEDTLKVNFTYDDFDDLAFNNSMSTHELIAIINKKLK